MLPLASYHPTCSVATLTVLSASDIFVSDQCLTLCVVACTQDAALVEPLHHMHHVAQHHKPTRTDFECHFGVSKPT